MQRSIKWYALPTAIALFGAMAWGTSAIASGATTVAHHQNASTSGTATPIKHLVVIFDENVSFDHYFGTYPYAPNPSGEPSFHAKPGTPQVNGLYSAITKSGPVGPLLTDNPNGSNPVRLDYSDPETCDQDHDYTPEQLAADHGAEDQYPANTGNNLTLAQCLAGHNFNGQPELWQLYATETSPEVKQQILQSMYNNGDVAKLTEVAKNEKDPNVRAQLAGHSLNVHSNVYQQPQLGVLRRAMRKLDKRLQ